MLPENWPVLQIFCASQTQWRVGNCGVTGLDYTAVKLITDARGIWFADILPGLQVCENEYLIFQDDENNARHKKATSRST